MSETFETYACPATYEAVREQEDDGSIGCPICGYAASEHPREDDPNPVSPDVAVHDGPCHAPRPTGQT